MIASPLTQKGIETHCKIVGEQKLRQLDSRADNVLIRQYLTPIFSVIFPDEGLETVTKLVDAALSSQKQRILKYLHNGKQLDPIVSLLDIVLVIRLFLVIVMETPEKIGNVMEGDKFKSLPMLLEEFYSNISKKTSLETVRAFEIIKDVVGPSYVDAMKMILKLEHSNRVLRRIKDDDPVLIEQKTIVEWLRCRTH